MIRCRFSNRLRFGILLAVVLAAIAPFAAAFDAPKAPTPTSEPAVAETPQKTRPEASDSRPLSHVVDLLNFLVRVGKLPEAYEFARRVIAADDIPMAAWIEQNAADLHAPFLYELARRLQKTAPEAAAKWYYAGTLWARYDARRCKDRSAGQGLAVLAAGLELLAAWGNDHPAEDVAAAEAALEWERNHPSLRMSPAWICIHGMTAYQAQAEGRELQPADWLVPEAEWPDLREKVRSELAAHVAKLRREARASTATEETKPSEASDFGYAFRPVAMLKAGFGVSKIAWSRDGRLIAAGGPLGGKIAVFDVAAKKIISHINIRALGGYEFLFTADDRKLVTGDFNRQENEKEAVAVVWDVASGDKAGIVPCPRRSDQSCIYAVAERMVLSPDGKTLVVGYATNTGVPALGVYDAETWEFRRAFGPPYAGIRALAMSPDGRHVAAGTFKGMIEIWDFQSGEKVVTLSAYSGGVRGVTYIRSGKILVTAGEDSELKPHPKTGSKVWARFDPALQTWDLTSRTVARTKVYERKFQIKNVASDAHHDLVAVTQGGDVAYVHTTDKFETLELNPSIKYIGSLAFSVDSSFLAAGGDDLVLIWKIDSIRRSTDR